MTELARILHLDPPGYQIALAHFSRHFETCDDCSDEDGLCEQGIELAQSTWALLNVAPKARPGAKKTPSASSST
jgi:hypothetical protein